MSVTVKEFQNLIKRTFYHKDSLRGVEKTFVWFVEEVGELAKSFKKKERELMEAEFADVFAWLCSLANLVDVNLEGVSFKKYGKGCPKCGKIPCICEEPFKKEVP